MGEGWPQDRSAQIGLLIVLLVLAIVAVMGTDFMFSTFGGSPAASATAPAATATTFGAAAAAQSGVVAHPGTDAWLRF
jgi:flagellar basal body-associated protein FliL